MGAPRLVPARGGGDVDGVDPVLEGERDARECRPVGVSSPVRFAEPGLDIRGDVDELLAESARGLRERRAQALELVRVLEPDVKAPDREESVDPGQSGAVLGTL